MRGGTQPHTPEPIDDLWSSCDFHPPIEIGIGQWVSFSAYSDSVVFKPKQKLTDVFSSICEV